MKNYLAADSDLHQEITTWRQDFHAHPETAFEEFRTAEKIISVLQTLPNIEVHSGIATTGIVAVLTGKHGDNGKMIGLRADIDALNITEETDVNYRSVNEGKMHACGHDGHTSMLLGAAKYLHDNADFSGRVAFIFQPAEENGGGGEVMVKEGLFERFPCDSVYGMHNWPGLPVGQFAVHEGAVMASADSFDIVIQGRGAHAAMPNLGVDPIVIASQVVTALQTIVSRNTAPTDTAVVSITQINAGSAYNIIPDTATLCGTMRTFSGSVHATLQQRIQQIVSEICQAHQASGEVHFHDAYPATINHAQEARECAKTAMQLVGEENVLLNEPPSMGAEDFSYMLMEKPGAYIWLGNGEESYGLHHPKYNFNDEALPLGVSYWVALTYDLLGES